MNTTAAQRRPRSLAFILSAIAVAGTGTSLRAGPLDYQKTELGADAEPMASGPFQPTWDSLAKQQVPEWFRDAKFGMWAHWGPQCEPADGDWYARHMYIEDRGQYTSHLKAYGHPSEQGFKDIINIWKADKWDPEKLVALYKNAGAKYFFALANHHDNFDLWDSKYQPWNSTKLGPRKNIIAGWEKAARANGLPFGVSVHASHAFTWYEPSQGADTKGEKAGVPYDGKLTKADGKGKWWDGLDPQQLYHQNHKPRPDQKNGPDWEWQTRRGQALPDAAYVQNIYDRTIDLINQHRPDLMYFDDTILPLYPISDVGLKIAAHFHNQSAARNNGVTQGVLFGKVLKDATHKKAITWDVERGAPDQTQEIPWQTDTCIGDWHYNQSIVDRRSYKSPAVVVHMLADIVSKNGNLLLNVPVRGDGTIDEQELAIVEGIGAWVNQNGEAIFATRPWKTFGEGPALEGQAPIQAQGFNEGKGKPFTAEDVRFTQKGDAIYAITLGEPKGETRIKSLGNSAALVEGEVKSVTLLGSDKPLKWRREDDALVIDAPAKWPNAIAASFKVTTGK